MRVRIVCYEDVNAWILGKFALRLRDGLEALGVAIDIAKVPDMSAEINHHIIYYNYDGSKSTLDTVMITHIDSEMKRRMLKSQLVQAEMGICTSLDTVIKLASTGIPRSKLCYVNPGHDNVMKPRKLLLGITSKVQPSGCKREFMLPQLAQRMSLDDFEFRIMGAGWESIVNELTGMGVAVNYINHFDFDHYVEMMPNLDYYLYLGQDEGSMGFIDALAAGVPTIVTPQGFHLDAKDGISYAFNTVEELEQILSAIAEKRRKLTLAVASWTWSEYARKHLLVWNNLLNRKSGRSIPETLQDELDSVGFTQTEPIANNWKARQMHRIKDLAWRYLYPLFRE